MATREDLITAIKSHLAPGVTPALIPAATAISGVIDLVDQRVHRVAIPATWATAAITFQVSSDGTNFNDLYVETGEYTLSSSLAVASRSIVVDQAVFYGIRYLKVRSGTAAAPVNQAAGPTVTLVTVTR